jgi:hypothetical protein
MEVQAAGAAAKEAGTLNADDESMWAVPQG